MATIVYKKKNWFLRLFYGDDRRTRIKTMYDFFSRIYQNDMEYRCMARYIRENMSCDDYEKKPSRVLIRRYGLDYYTGNSLAWLLLEKYFSGEIIIKEKDAQPK